jgi:hypothetical protein
MHQRLKAFLLSKLLVVVWLLCSCGVKASLGTNRFEKSPNVEFFDDVTIFQTRVAESDAIWMITFYSSSSSSDASQQSERQLVSEISLAATITRGVFHFGAVDVSADAGKEIAEQYEIRSSSLPSIYMFTDDSKPKKYTGKKTTQEILNKMVQTGIETIQARAGGANGSTGGTAGSSESSSKGPSKVVHLTSENFQEQVLDSPLVSAVACKYDSALVKSLLVTHTHHHL